MMNMLDKLNVDAILLTDYYNKRKLTGFTGTTGIGIITKDEKIFYSDSRYTLQATKEVEPYGFIFKEKGKNLYEAAKEDLDRLNVKKLGIDGDDLSYSDYLKLKDMYKGIELVNVSSFLKSSRIVKTKEELENIKRACEISDIAFKEVLKVIKVGMSEKEIAAYIEYIQRLHGATDRSFETIVASGVRSSMPHGVASDKKIQENEFITMDFGCYYNGYVSDMTRTIYIGKISDRERKMYDIVLKAQKEAIKKVVKNASVKDIDNFVRSEFEKEGVAKNFTHSLGHGIGLEIHEGNILSYRSDAKLVNNEVVTIEPGLYFDNEFGIRIEDDVIVCDDTPIILNKADKELIILEA